jgi:hypothetical protein
MSEASVEDNSAITLHGSAPQREALTARIKGGIQIMQITWGLAWFVGNGLFFLSAGPDGHVFVKLPTWVPLTALLALLVVAAVTTVIIGMKVFGNGATDSTYVRQAKLYGMAWLLGFAALLITIGKVTHGLSNDEQGLIWVVTTTELASALQLAGSAIWLDRGQFRLGIWLTVINVIGAIAGQGWQALIVAVAGGGVMLYLGFAGIVSSKRRSSLPIATS